MLHTKFQGHHHTGSEEEDFWMFISYKGMGASLVMWPIHFYQSFIALSGAGSTRNRTSVGPTVSQE